MTVPHNPEQNGIAERKNRSLLDTACCLLLQSGLPSRFWAEAVNTANYIRNRCPTKSLEGKTPYEVWNGEVPDVSHLREFGDRVYCLDSNPGKGKLAPRSKEGVLVGYSDECEGYRVWLTDDRKVVVSRDVRFAENPAPCSNECQDFGLEDDNSRDACRNQTINLLDLVNHQGNDEVNKDTGSLEVQRMVSPGDDNDPGALPQALLAHGTPVRGPG